MNFTSAIKCVNGRKMTFIGHVIRFKESSFQHIDLENPNEAIHYFAQRFGLAPIRVFTEIYKGFVVTPLTDQIYSQLVSEDCVEAIEPYYVL